MRQPCFRLIAVGVLLLEGCGTVPTGPPPEPPPTIDTFPLIDGMEWVYSLSDPQLRPATAIIKFTVHEAIPHYLDPWELFVITEDGDTTNIFRGSVSLRDSVIYFNQTQLFPMGYELHFPLVEGKAWDFGGVTVGERSTVVVPAGTFKAAVRITVRGQDFWTSEEFEQDQWFVPDVGMVKLVWEGARSKPTPHRVWELTEVRLPPEDQVNP